MNRKTSGITEESWGGTGVKGVGWLVRLLRLSAGESLSGRTKRAEGALISALTAGSDRSPAVGRMKDCLISSYKRHLCDPAVCRSGTER